MITQRKNSTVMDPEKPTQHPLSRAISWFYSSLLIIDSGFPFNFRIFPVFVLSNNFCLFFPVDFFALLSITCSLLAEKRHGYRLAFYTQECKVTKTFRKIQSLQCAVQWNPVCCKNLAAQQGNRSSFNKYQIKPPNLTS